MRLDRGTVALLDLVGPCVVISDPDVIADQRFPVVCVVPITGTPAEGALYPRLDPGPSGLTKPSYALIDQLRSVDKRRIRHLFGKLRPAEIAAIDQGVLLFLGLEPMAALY